MNFNFNIYDKLNFVAFDCFSLVRFSFENNDYLMYYRLNDNAKCGIYTSRLIKNSDGSYAIFDISKDEKDKLDIIARNIFSSLPTSYSDGIDIDKLVNDFCFENKIIFSKQIPHLNDQFLCNNSLLADSSLEYCNFVKSFYDAVLPRVNILPLNSSIVWELPSSTVEKTQSDLISNTYSFNETTDNLSSVSYGTSNSNSIGLGNIEAIIPITSVNNEQVLSTVSNSQDATLNVSGTGNMINGMNNFDFQVFGDGTVNNSNFKYSNSSYDNNFSFNYNSSSNYGVQDNTSSGGGPELSTNKTKVLKKNAGFASNSYVIIGSLCLILSAIVIIISIYLVKNL